MVFLVVLSAGEELTMFPVLGLKVHTAMKMSKLLFIYRSVLLPIGMQEVTVLTSVSFSGDFKAVSVR